MEVGDEVLCPAGEELVGGSEAPGDAADVGVPVGRGAGDGVPGCSTKGAVEDEVVEGVSGPAAGARELVQGAQEALWYYPVLVCTPCLRRLDVRAERPVKDLCTRQLPPY